MVVDGGVSATMQKLAARKQIPMLERLGALDLTLDQVGDSQFQQEALELMYVEMVLDPKSIHGGRIRVAAGRELAHLRGYGQEEKGKRILETISRFREALRVKPQQLPSESAEE